MTRQERYYKSKKGVATVLYGSQICNSKRRKSPPPEYSKQEFVDWLFSHKNFSILYEKWEKGGHKSDDKPSIDRIDDYKPYSFSNIRLTTWKENNKKGNEDRKNGINNKNSISVTALNKKTMKKKVFPSACFAERKLGLPNGSVLKCLKQAQRAVGGFFWFKTEDFNNKTILQNMTGVA